MTSTASSSALDAPLALPGLLAERWSPRGFNPARRLRAEEFSTLFEAARWAPSAFNAQPWAFLAGGRGTETFERILATLIPFNQEWAGRSSLLVVGLYADEVAGRRAPSAQFDLGLAVGQVLVEVGALGLAAHPFTGFDAAAAEREFDVHEPYHALVGFAVGEHSTADDVPEKIRAKDAAQRSRKPLADLFYRAPEL